MGVSFDSLRSVRAAALLMSLGCVCGCVSARVSQLPAAGRAAQPPAGVPGVYHVISRGQTLWRISRIYGVDLDELVRVNRISDATRIEVGQRLLIPVQHKQAYCRMVSGEEFIWPLRGRVITVVRQEGGGYKGINIQPFASDMVQASRSGTVVFVNEQFVDLGKTLIIDHGDGFMTVYGRNAEIFVRPGDVVSQGTRIARAGSSGRDSRTYLHFQIRRKHVSQDPHLYLAR